MKGRRGAAAFHAPGQPGWMPTRAVFDHEQRIERRAGNRVLVTVLVFYRCPDGRMIRFRHNGAR